MGTTQVRVELKSEDYRILTDEQLKRKAITGKKPPLSELVLEYFTTGLQVKLSGLNSDSLDIDPNINQVHSVTDIQQKALELTQKENALKDREKEVVKREGSLRFREKDLYSQLNDLYDRKDEMIEQREESLEKITDVSIQKFELDVLNKTIIKKDEEIRQMKIDIGFYKENVLSQLRTIENKLDKKPDSNVWRDWVLPGLSSVIGAGNLVNSTGAFKSIKEIKPMILEIEEKIAGLNPENKEERDIKAKLAAITGSLSKKKILPTANTGGVS